MDASRQKHKSLLRNSAEDQNQQGVVVSAAAEQEEEPIKYTAV
jgi:hypothetical protein